MSRILYLYSYNKYFNRKLKKESSFDDYLNLTTGEDASYLGLLLENTNFNIEDGVYAKHVFNIPTSATSNLYAKQPDYVVVETKITKKENGVDVVQYNELTRWFVLECIKTRGNQYQVSLKRDVVADFINKAQDSPIFVEKGMLNNNDPFIFNNEGMEVNQIKQKEILLKDKTNTAWVVGYLAKDVNKTNITADTKVASKITSFNDLPSIIRNNIDTTNPFYYDNDNMSLGFLYCRATTDNYFQQWRGRISHIGDSVTTTSDKIGLGAYNENLGYPRLYNSIEYFNNLMKQKYEEISDIKSIVFNLIKIGKTFIDEVLDYENTYFEKDGKYYKIKYEFSSNDTEEINFILANLNSTIIGQKLDAFRQGLLTGTMVESSNFPRNELWATIQYYLGKYYIKSEEVNFEKIETSITSAKNVLLDAPYDMFAIPLGELDVLNATQLQFTTREEIALQMARGLSLELTTANCYDIQLLPYCPCLDLLNEDGKVELSALTLHKDYEFIKNDGTNVNVGIILFPNSSKGSFDIEVDDESLKKKNSAIDIKIASETDLIRFVSPNYASIFEVNAQKNDGIDIINVDWNYKPYSPYIHVAPVFKGLYGNDFNDPKGLICSGDFSISTASSKWEEYQVANKNYELMFNRQIENLDINNSIAMSQLKTTSAIQGIATSIGAGAFGAKAGGPAVGIATGIATGALNIIGATADIEYLARQQNENRDYSIDMYNYNLGNIKAIPNTLSKVSAFTNNNKLFPAIEIYSCTEEEKETLRKKIIYNGMTVMRIDTLRNFYNEGSFFKGQLVRLEQSEDNKVDEDNHIIVELYNELMRGVYF